MKKLFLALIRFYRRNISPLTSAKCRFTPTCSQYALEAFKMLRANRCYKTVVRLCNNANLVNIANLFSTHFTNENLCLWL